MSSGNKVALIVLGCVCFLVLLVGSVGLMLYSGFQKSNAVASARIDALFDAIEQGNFAETYQSFASPELRASTTRQQQQATGDAISEQLGRLVSKSMTSFNIRQHNTESSMEVEYDAVFEKGAGKISAKLQQEAGTWRFVSFRVTSPLLTMAPQAARCPACGSEHAKIANFCPSCGVELPTTPAASTPQEKPAESQRN